MGNKADYDKQYQREKLKQKSVWFTKAEAQEIENYLQEHGETFAGFVKRVIREAMRETATADEARTAKPEQTTHPSHANNPEQERPALAVKESSRIPNNTIYNKPIYNSSNNAGYC